MKEIYINGQVYTVTDNMAQAFVVENGKFLYVGDNEGALKLKEADSVVKDLNNKFVTPGFNDSHMHLISTGNCLNMVDLCGANSMDEMIDLGKEYIKEKQYDKDRWIVGFGWNNDNFEGSKIPTRYDLDKISTEYPICYIRVCYHVYVVNSKALELAEINKNTSQVQGGSFQVDENGEPLGIFEEAAVELITSKIAPLKFEEIKEAIEIAAESCNSKGITSVQTDDLCEFSQVPYEEILRAFKELEEENKLKVRVYEQCRFDSFSSFTRFIQDNFITGMGSDRFKIGPLKLLCDGSLGARTALLNEPYSDDSHTCGIQVMNQEDLNKWVTFGHENNMQIAIHAIGDKAMYMVIEAYDKALKERPLKGHCHGIVHAQITDKYILNKMKELELLGYVQTIFMDYDNTIVEKRVGKERARDTYNYRTMLDMGIKIANGSDAPVEWPVPLKGIQIAVTRTSFSEGSESFLPEQAMTVKEAIDSFTIGGAYASFEERIKGSIEEGKLADFIVMEENLFLIDPYKIKDVEVLETYLQGELVWRKK